jgi:uncharacterized protein YukE
MTEVQIPGSPDALDALASQMSQAAADIDSVRDRVASNGLDRVWIGRAAESFRSALHQLPGELANVSEGFNEAASTITRFAATLAELQQQERWYDEHLNSAEQELRDANIQSANARTKLHAANLQRSLATDPVSLGTAERAVDAGESLVKQAAADIEDIGGGIAQLVSGTDKLRCEYEDAVRVCATAIETLQTTHSRPLSGLRGHFDRMIGHLEHDDAVWWHDGGRDLRDGEKGLERAGGIALRVFHDEWGVVRTALVNTSTALADVTLIVCGGMLIIGVALAPVGLGEGVLAADAVVLDASSDVLEVESDVILTGDVAATVTGDGQYAEDIPGDVVGVFPVDKLAGSASRELDKIPVLRRATQRLVSDGEERLGVNAAKRAAGSAVKLGEGYVQGKLADLTEWATRRVTPLISAPLENPEVLRFTVPPAGAEAL